MGKEARTVYHFDVPVYETNALSPSDEDNYYIQEASGNRYLRNTDGQFMTYSEDTDEEYLWRIRRLPSTYGSRYMFISRTNSGQHLSEDGRLSSASDYSRHSFNLWHKCGSDDLYAIERSSSVSGGLWENCSGIVCYIGEPRALYFIPVPFSEEGRRLFCKGCRFGR